MIELYNAGTSALDLSGKRLGDADEGSPTTRLLNISTRGYVGSGAPLVSGVVISEEGPRTVLIRTIGPTLNGFGLSGALADPTLTLYSGETELTASDNWADTDATNIATVGTTVGAFALTSGTADAVLLVKLAPGVYTAQATSTNPTASALALALIQIYLVP